MTSMGGGDDLTIHAELDNDVSPELREIREDLRQVGSQAGTTGRQASRSAKGFDVLHRAGKLAATGVKLAFVGALAAGYAAVRLLSASFREATEAQKVGATTAAIIKSTGGAAKVTAGHIGRLSTRLSLMAGIDDELIQTGANLLLTFKQVRNEAGKGNDVFDRATTAALDLSAAGFGSMDSASKMLGKALNDPLKGITALSRAGVTFTQGQQDTIKSLVEQGDLLTAQKIILGEVESQVGGVAKAQATWRDKAVVYIGNIEEKIGKALLPVLDDVAKWFVKKGGPALDGWVRTFRREGVPAIHDFVDEAKPVVTKWLPKLVDLAGDLASDLKTGAGWAADLVGAFSSMPSWARKAIIGGGIAAAVGSKLGVGGLIGSNKPGASSGLLGLVSKAKPLPVFVVNNLPGGATGPGAAATAATAAATAAAAGAGVKLPKWAPFIPVGLGSAPDQQSALDTARGKHGDELKMLSPEEFRQMVESRFGILKTVSQAAESAATQASLHALLDPLDTADVHTKNLGKSLDKVNATKVAPPVTTPGLPESQRTMDSYKLTLQAVGQPVTTHIDADTSAASAKISALARQANAALAAGIGGLITGGSTPAPAPAGPSTPPPTHREHVHPRTTPRGQSSRGGVTVHAGGIHVDARGAATNVDVERAVLEALDRYERDRYERGNP